MKIEYSLKFVINLTGTERATVLLKTNVTSMALSSCNAALMDYNRDANQPSLRSGISMSQFCAFDPKARHDACQGKQ